MKKYIILSLLVVFTLTLSSCWKDGTINVRENIQIDVVQKNWNGHRYNVFYTTKWARPDVSVVHDPDCPKCTSQKIN